MSEKMFCQECNSPDVYFYDIDRTKWRCECCGTSGEDKPKEMNDNDFIEKIKNEVVTAKQLEKKTISDLPEGREKEALTLCLKADFFDRINNIVCDYFEQKNKIGR